MPPILQCDALSAGQRRALADFAAFVRSDADCFLLRGAAGTGKTTLLRAFAAHLDGQSRRCRLMAPTGRAARVLRERTGRDAATIHRSIYHLPKIVERTRHVLEYHFALRDDLDEKDCVFLIDEASMVGDDEARGERLRFGSGRLLSDLLAYVFGRPPRHRSKLVFVGDRFQLPPVGSDRSHALDEGYLARGKGLRVVAAELDEVLRHGAGSGILRCAKRLRDAVAQGRVAMLRRPQSDDVAVVAAGAEIEACKRMLDQRGDDFLVVTHSNRQALDWNRIARAHLGRPAGSIVAGDRLLVVQNNPLHGLMNGEFTVVVTAEDPRETRTVLGRDLHFRDLRIAVEDGSGAPCELGCKIVENLVDAPVRDLGDRDLQALLVLAKLRFEDRFGVPAAKRRPDFYEFLRTDPYFNALRVKFGYAATCHKAQGGEWPVVMVNFPAYGLRGAEGCRWAYTAVTRASERLLLIDPPSLVRS